ncbi:MAG: flippase [Cyanobacteria bacterium J06598_3]
MKKLLSKIDFSYVYSFLGEATLGLTFVLYILIGRTLGPEQYGIFTSANALAGILTFFILFGFSDLLAREVAADSEKGLKSTATFLFIETVNCLLVLLFLFPIASVLGFESSEMLVCYLVVIAGGGRCTKQTLRAAFRGLGKFRSETIAVSIERSALFLFAGTALLLTDQLVWVVGTLAIVRVADTLYWFLYLKRKESLSSPITLKGVKRSFAMAYPFAISGVLWILYYQVDMLMLKAIAPSQQAGFYGAAYSLIEIFSALPRVIFAVTFPKLTRCYAQDPSQMPEKIRQAALLLLSVVLPFVTIAGFAQTLLVKLTYGTAFLPAVSALALLLPSLSMKMFASLVSYVFQATRREKLLPFVLLATVCLNIAVNALLIPQLGAVGAALATLLSEVTFATVGLIIVVRVGYTQVGITLLLTAVIGLVVASIPSMLLYGLNPVAAIGLMAVCLSAIALLMRRKMNPAL